MFQKLTNIKFYLEITCYVLCKKMVDKKRDDSILPRDGSILSRDGSILSFQREITDKCFFNFLFTLKIAKSENKYKIILNIM